MAEVRCRFSLAHAALSQSRRVNSQFSFLNPPTPLEEMKTQRTIPRSLNASLAGLSIIVALLFAASAAARAETLYVGNYGNDTIQSFTSAGVGSVFANTPSAPYGLSFDPAGNLFVALTFDDTILKVTSDGQSSVFARTSPGNDPRGLVFDSAGNLYAAINTANTILKFTPNPGAMAVGDPRSSRDWTRETDGGNPRV